MVFGSDQISSETFATCQYPIYLYSTARVKLDNASPSGLGVFSPTTRIKPANLSISYSELNDKYLHIKIKLITLTHALAFI